MTSDVHQPDEFIAYPTNRVVGTIADPERARAAIEALMQVGFAQHDIDILHEEKDLHRPDSTGAAHRFLTQFQRTLTRKLTGDYKHLRLGEEFVHLRHYIEDVRAGRYVIMVLAKKRDKREVAANILGAHGAEFIEYYGRWAWHSLEAHPATPVASAVGDPMLGRTYQVELGGGTATHVRLDSESKVTILRKNAGFPDLANLPATHLRPHLLMVGWQETDKTTNVHIYDLDSGEVHAFVTYADRRVHRARGTVRPVD
jgi:hypothetical protein